MHLQRIIRRKHRGWRLLILVSVFVIGYLGILIPAINLQSLKSRPDDLIHIESHSFRKLLASDNSTDEGFNYPPDAFSLEQRRHGAVILHVIGLAYMFVALAIVCDEFFVPCLSVIIEKIKVSEDVAGATFMAAGGSAPEFFTSLFGVFFARSNVGIGTIVGSAVFNILFVIGMCAVVSKTVLELTWWPLFRDVTFYSIDLIVLIVFFRDEVIEWWEALVLLLLYVLYVLFMKFNVQIETFVKTKILRGRKTQVHSDDNLLTEEITAKRKPHRSCSIPILHSGTNHFRHGVLQLMIHTIDPISEGHVQDKAIQLHAVANVNKVIDTSDEGLIGSHNQNGDIKNGGVKNHSVADKNSNKPNMQVHAISNGNTVGSDSPKFSTRVVSPAKSVAEPIPEEGVLPQGSSTRNSNNTDSTAIESPQGTNPQNPDRSQTVSPENEIEDEDEPLDMSWPDTWRKRVTYVLLAPLTFPMWIMIPDVRRPEKKKWYVFSFMGSIFWIVIFSYLMIWWANQTGETIGISDEIMGLTILAAGTSIPDLITSVIVAKKGLGDMAVSSSVGSNIFDITVGLPVPWLLYSAIYNGASISVDSDGLVCSIILLFGMLLVVVVTIAASKWKMTKLMGVCMLGLYCVFVIISVLLELTLIPCPV